MITVRLNGGLGNQLFQYACGRALAHRLKTELHLDLCDFAPKKNSKATRRHYELGIFNIGAQIKYRRGFVKQFVTKAYYPLRKYGLAPWVLRKTNIFTEAELFTFDPRFNQLKDSAFLFGYFQTERYFADISSVIRADLTFPPELNEKNTEMLQIISQCNAVSLHVRRGDYVSNTDANREMGLCGMDYYKEALNYITAKVDDPHIFIFSDEPEAVMRELNFGSYKHTVINHNKGRESYIDMQLMSQCKHNIIANSSFSWWGAWLNNNAEKIVIAPKQWLRNEEKNKRVKELIPKSWIRL